MSHITNPPCEVVWYLSRPKRTEGGYGERERSMCGCVATPPRRLPEHGGFVRIAADSGVENEIGKKAARMKVTRKICVASDLPKVVEAGSSPVDPAILNFTRH